MTMMTLDVLEDYLDDSAALFMEPRAVFDGCIVGLAERADGLRCVAYDSERVVQALMNDNGWDRDDAVEWFQSNTLNAYAGPGTPIFIARLIED